MRWSILKPMLVVALGAIALASPPLAKADSLTYHCNAYHYDTGCQGQSEDWREGFCAAHCGVGNVGFTYCYSNGTLACYDDPT